MSTSARTGDDLLRAFWSLWNARDWDGLRGLVTADFVHHEDKHVVDIDGFIAGSKEACDQFGDYQISINQVVDGGDQVAVRWTGRGRHDKTFLGEEPSGTELVVEAMDFYRIAGERIAENWQIIDMTALRKQIESIATD